MAHSSENTLYRIIKSNFPRAVIVLIISFSAIHPAVVMSENNETNGYQSKDQTEVTSDTDDCE